MSTDLPTDAESFALFLNAQLGTRKVTESPEELLRRWREEQADAISDVRRGIQNMNDGLGRPFDEVDREIRDEFGFAKHSR